MEVETGERGVGRTRSGEGNGGKSVVDELPEGRGEEEETGTEEVPSSVAGSMTVSTVDCVP